MASKKKGNKSGLPGDGMMNPGTGPGQDGFNQESHVTKFGNDDDDRTHPQVGRDDSNEVDSRGKGTIMSKDC